MESGAWHTKSSAFPRSTARCRSGALSFLSCSDGLGYGNNGRAALITRGLVEISRIALKLGANPLTLSGLAGMGDLVLTCTGQSAHGTWRSMGECLLLSLPEEFFQKSYIRKPRAMALVKQCNVHIAGDLSRNRTVGLRIGKGETVSQITEGMTAVAEGVLTSRAAHQLAQKLGVEVRVLLLSGWNSTHGAMIALAHLPH